MRFPWATYLIITADSKEIAEGLKNIVSSFLKSRGLILSEEKLQLHTLMKDLTFLGGISESFRENLLLSLQKTL